MTDLFLVTYRKDFPYLRHSLRSVARFCDEFNQLLLLLPQEDSGVYAEFLSTLKIKPRFPINPVFYEDKPGKGMLQHMVKIMEADLYSTAEHICHIDADCVYDTQTTPHDLFIDGKPILRYEPFSSIIRRHDAMERWLTCTAACLPFTPQNETMRAHGATFHRSTYAKAREMIEQKTNTRYDRYMLKGQNAFPQEVSEFNVLGNVALHDHPERYHPVRQVNDTPTPDNHMVQFWSHSPPEQSQRIWIRGQEEDVIPSERIMKILGPENAFVPTPEEEERMAQ